MRDSFRRPHIAIGALRQWIVDEQGAGRLSLAQVEALCRLADDLERACGIQG